MKNIVDRLNKEEYQYNEEERPLYHKNCAEILLMAANERYKLELNEKFYKAICPFGGGIQYEKTCGALIGAVAAIGIIYTEEKPSINEKMKDITKKFVFEFEREFGAIDCAYIKEHHRSEITGCDLVKVKTGEILEKVISEEK
ncbi:MAG TPA: C_GCAxxG_C_C family protein [Eubacteriaceae bacterium]|nr:C_GCAxxG_C_C family protein [Eubacteriaceae bacterium]